MESAQVAAGCGDFVDEPDVPDVDVELDDESPEEPEVDVEEDEDESPDDEEAPSVAGLRLSVR